MRFLGATVSPTSPRRLRVSSRMSRWAAFTTNDSGIMSSLHSSASFSESALSFL